MSTMASQITSLTIVYSSIYSDADQRKHQSSVPLAFVQGIHPSPVNSPHKWPVTRKMLPFDDVIMKSYILYTCEYIAVVVAFNLTATLRVTSSLGRANRLWLAIRYSIRRNSSFPEKNDNINWSFNQITEVQLDDPCPNNNNDAKMSALTSQITGIWTVCSVVCSGAH